MHCKKECANKYVKGQDQAVGHLQQATHALSLLGVTNQV